MAYTKVDETTLTVASASENGDDGNGDGDGVTPQPDTMNQMLSGLVAVMMMGAMMKLID